MFTNFKRVFHFAITDFYRNRGLSIAAIFILAVTILLMTGLFYMRGISSFLIETISNKIDITAYFQENVEEKDILAVRNEIIQQVPQVKNVEYVSSNQALENFKSRHGDNPVISRALVEVGDNPFLPSLNITTSGDPAEYEQVSRVLQSEYYAGFIEKVDFSQKKDTIEKIFSITSNANMFGLVLGALLALVAILVVFNTVKLVINSSRDEITTMRVVGASDWFVRMPFIIEGGLFGLTAMVIGFMTTVLLSYFLSQSLAAVLPGFNLFRFFISNALLILGIQLVFGVGLGILSSYIVVRKHLKTF